MTDSTRNDAAAEALHALVARSSSTSGLDEPALGEEPRAVDPAGTSESAANSAGVNGSALTAPFSKIPRLPDSDDGEARMPANRMRPPALASRVTQFVEPRAPKPVLAKLLNGNGVAVVDKVVEQPAAEAVVEESETSNDPEREALRQVEVAPEAPASDEAASESPDVVGEESTMDVAHAAEASPQPPEIVSEAPASDDAPRESSAVFGVESMTEDAPGADLAPQIEEPPSATEAAAEAPTPPVLEGEVIDVVVEPVTEPAAESMEPSRDHMASIVDAIPIPGSEPASGNANLPTSLLDLDAPAFATFAPAPSPPSDAAPDAASRATAEAMAATSAPQHVDVRKISPDEAPAPIEVQRPLAPSRRTPVVPIFADASASSSTSSTPASASPSATSDPIGTRSAFTIAELAAADPVAPMPTAVTAPAALPAATTMPPRDVTLTDLAAAVHGSSGASADASAADDLTMVPAQTVDVFARPTARSGKLVAQQSASFRRTIIPILLTLGMIAIALGGGWFALPPDSGLRGDGPAIAVALLCTGPILLGLAALNMLQVRSILRPVVRSR